MVSNALGAAAFHGNKEVLEFTASFGILREFKAIETADKHGGSTLKYKAEY